MAVYHGLNADFWLYNASNVLTEYTSYIDSITFNPTAETAEKTVLNDTTKSYVAGLKDGTFSIEGPYDATIIAALNSALGAAAAKLFEYYPNGNTTGRDKWSGGAFCTSLNIDTNLGSVGRYSADFQISGAVALGAAS